MLRDHKRLVAVLCGLGAFQCIAVLAPHGGQMINIMPDAFLWLAAVLAAATVLAWGMLSGVKEGSGLPLYTGIAGLSVILTLGILEKGAARSAGIGFACGMLFLAYVVLRLVLKRK